MKNSLIKTILLPAGTLMLLGSPAYASMGNTGTNYGLLPSDVASAQALSLFGSNISAAYYNPAALVLDERSELTGAIFHAEHDLSVQSNRSAYDGTIQDTPSQQLMIGMKADLSGLLKHKHPMYFGFIAGVDKFGKELLAFSSSAEAEGAQSFKYDRQPLFLTASIGTKLWRGINVGAGARVTLHNDAELLISNNFAGDTQYEHLQVDAKPVFRPVVGMHMNWGETFCKVANCWMDNLDTALTYKASSDTQTSVTSSAVIPGAVPSPGIPIEVNNVIDSFQPAVTSLGFKYDFGGWRLGVTGEYQAWSRLGSEFEDDTIKDQANLDFKDIFVPRVGAEIELNDMFMVTAGLAWEESPLESDISPDVNYVDADRWIAGVGLTTQLKHVPLMAWPIEMSVGYQYQKLEERDFELSSTPRSPNDPISTYGTATTEGEVNVFSGSITMKF